MPSRSAALVFAVLAVPAVAVAEFPVPEVLLWESVSTPPRAHAAVPALALPADSGAAPAAHLVWLDPSGIGDGTAATAKPEVVSLMRGLGVAVSWRRGNPHELARPGELRVILLNRPGTRDKGTSVLGATPAQADGEPHVWVHVPSVALALGIDRHDGEAMLDPRSAHCLGIGLARVIAHEIVHAIAPELPHGTGLMSMRLDRRMLTASTIPVDPEVGLALRAALANRRAAVPAAAGAGALLAAETTTDREEP